MRVRHRVVGKHRALAKRPVVVTLGAVAALTLAGAVTVVVSSSAPSTQASTVSQTSAIRTGSVVRFNVGATHSPQVEQMLAGHAAVAPRAAAAQAAGSSAAASTVQGIDVSSAQHSGGAAINWNEVAGDGYKFAFVKASEGSYYVNPYYASDIAGAQAAGMFVAPYAFAVPNYSGGALQADYLLDNADYAPDGRLLPPILDIEGDPYLSGDGTNSCYGLTPAQLVSWIGAFTAEIQRRTGQHPVIYTDPDWWNSCTGDSNAFTADPLWIANTEVSAPALPAAWQNWAYWQYTSVATVPGISGTNNVDSSYLSSTALELAAPGNQSDRVGNAVSVQASALDAGPAGGSAPAIAYNATGLPTGTQINPATGAVSGTLPAAAATFPVVITASAQGDQNATQKFSWYAHGRVTLANLASKQTSIGAPVRDQIRARDALSGCTLQYSATGLPPGLTISTCGMISGWPTRSGSFSAKVRTTDSSGATVASGSVAWKVTRANGRGPAGHLVLHRDGKCLAERSPADIAIETCSGAASERWTIAADGSVRIGGKCLTAKSASSTASAALDLTSCTGAQRWQLGSNAVLRYVSDSRCLADTGSKNGSRAVAAVCKATSNNTGSASTPSTSQQWTVPAGALTSDIAGYCASTLRATSGPSGDPTLRRCVTSGAQDWTIEPDGALRAGGKCLRTVSSSGSPGALLHLGSCTAGASDQVWQLAGGPVGVHLVNPASGLCLADPGDRATVGTLLRMEPCVATDPGTSWRVS
ncbi:MAG TPA: GH25 family lysozyme [Streptosporangiaceae bacterium]|nr:GH25 family lysozyme [Streptosporangiaceae bacterium]